MWHEEREGERERERDFIVDKFQFFGFSGQHAKQKQIFQFCRNNNI